MKTRLLVWAFLAALISNGAMIATAMAGPGRAGGPGWEDADAPMGRFEERGERYLERMASVLELSEAQQQQIRALHEAARAEHAPLREQLDASRKRVHELCAAEPVNREAVRAEIAAQVDAKTELVVGRAKVRSETLKLLTPEQRELAEKLKPKREFRRHGPRED